MKVCFFLGGFYQNGGIGRVTSVLANGLAESGKIKVVTLGYFNPGKPNIYQLSKNIQQEFLLEKYKSMTTVMLLNGEKKLRVFLEDNDIDVLVACGALFFPIAVRACKTIATKCICWEHSDPEGTMDHRGQGMARRYGIKKSDLNIVLTKRALEVYKEKYRAFNTVQIYNPVDPIIIHSEASYNIFSKKIISVGRLTYQKNFETAIKVAEKIFSVYPDWEWDIYGEGEEKEKLVSLVAEKGLTSNMHFCGQVMDLYSRYKNYSIMVMTSRYEGFPMSLLEGMGNRLPLVSFDVPTGPDEIIINGENGHLIQPMNIEEMVECLLRLMESSELRKEMSNKNKEQVRKFEEKEIIHKWECILQGILEK